MNGMVAPIYVVDGKLSHNKPMNRTLFDMDDSHLRLMTQGKFALCIATRICKTGGPSQNPVHGCSFPKT